MSPSRPFILRPIATSLLMAGLLLAASCYLVVAGLRLERQQLELRYRVGSALEQAERLQRQAQWADARALLERAGAGWGTPGPRTSRGESRGCGGTWT